MELICLYTWELLDSSLPWAEAGQTKQPGYSERSRDSSRKEDINHGDMVSPAPASDSAVSGMSLVYGQLKINHIMEDTISLQ